MTDSLRDLFEDYKYDVDSIYEGLVLDMATNLKQLMLSKHISSQQLAKLMQVDISVVYRIFGGETITFRKIAKVLAALQIDTEIVIKSYDKDNRMTLIQKRHK